MFLLAELVVSKLGSLALVLSIFLFQGTLDRSQLADLVHLKLGLLLCVVEPVLQICHERFQMLVQRCLGKGSIIHLELRHELPVPIKPLQLALTSSSQHKVLRKCVPLLMQNLALPRLDLNVLLQGRNGLCSDPQSGFHLRNDLALVVIRLLLQQEQVKFLNRHSQRVVLWGCFGLQDCGVGLAQHLRLDLVELLFDLRLLGAQLLLHL